MPRGRHRHSPPLHRLLPPSAIAGVSLVCAFGPWLFTQATALRVLAAAAAVTAVGGAVVMRRWDVQAGRQVADLTRARAGDEWRFEERVAELETDLEESRELRGKLEARLRAKRSELAGLRNEHAALLRRYATAETERASALEGRRLLEIESAVPSRALPPGAAAPTVPAQSGAPRAESAEGEAATDLDNTAGPAEAAGTADADNARTDAAGTGDARTEETGDDERPVPPAAFSPEGRHLYRRAGLALSRLDGDHGSARVPAQDAGTARPHAADTEAAADDEAEGQPEAVDGHQRATAANPAPGRNGSAEPGHEPDNDPEPDAATPPAPQSPQPGPTTASAPAQTAPPAPVSARPAPATGTGHFTVPTAVAVVPPAPVRRPVSGGGFDFFGTQAEPTSVGTDAVHDEDLADVVGQEALADRGADDAQDTGQASESHVIDLTAHDETEHIDVQGLRSAAS